MSQNQLSDDELFDYDDEDDIAFILEFYGGPKDGTVVEQFEMPDKVYLLTLDPKNTFDVIEQDNDSLEFYHYEISEVMDNFVRYEYLGIKKGLE